MFVRAKTIKNRKYAYLVSNTWKKGKVKQSVNKYLGAVIDLGSPCRDVFSFELDSSLSSRQLLRECISREFESFGFHRQNNKLCCGCICIDLVRGTIKKGSKQVVLALNSRFLHDKQLSYLLSFNDPEPESERPGTRLAEAFSDSGIRISPDVFIKLYKKLYRC